MFGTIVAVASGLGKSAIAVVRVSGPACDNILAAVAPMATLQERRVSLIKLQDCNGQLIDRAVVIRFNAPRSYTGEEMIEFQVTGSPAVLSTLLHTLRALPDIRLAEPGEFARRAFENGKMDLTEVEGLASIVEAETNAQLRHAHAMSSGAVRLQCDAVRDLLLQAIADVEAMLDFSDVEEDYQLTSNRSAGLIEEVEARLRNLLDRSSVSERLKTGMIVAIAGPPNSGKSTLLNYLAKRDIAIVSPFPGTTRDMIELSVDLRGFPIIFVDTAGIRETVDPIEAEGINRALVKAENADLVLWLQDSQTVMSVIHEYGNVQILRVGTKVDLEPRLYQKFDFVISAMTGEGIEGLLQAIEIRAQTYFSGAGNGLLNTERQFAAVRDALASVVEAKVDQAGMEFVAESLRHANQSLGRVSGRIEVEEVLGAIFSRLCVGK